MAWQPLTARGVARFAGASTRRLFALQLLTAGLAAGVAAWFLVSCWFPPVRRAIEAMPADGAIRSGTLEWAGENPQLLAENRFLAFTVDLGHAGRARSPAHVYVELGRTNARVYSLFGYSRLGYPQDRRIGFGRDALLPWWGAWSPVIVAFTIGGVLLGLLLSWQVLATLYAGPAWLVAFYKNRALNLAGAWRLAGAALIPGALFLCAVVGLYGSGVLDLVRLGAGFLAHFVVGWVYLWMGAARVQPLPGIETGNPFGGKTGPVLFWLGLSLAGSPAADFHVATNGNDSWSGKLAAPDTARRDGPFLTIERARQAVRQLKETSRRDGPIVVEISRGAYALGSPLQFTAADGGSAGSPVVYRAAEKGAVRLSGGIALKDFKPVTDQQILSRLDESARGNVLRCDLRAAGVTGYGNAGGGGLELFFQDRPMPLSRWPNEGFVRMAEVLGATPVDVRGTKGCVEGIFKFEGDRPKRWAEESDLWLHGYWFWDWSDQRHKVKSIDPAKQTIELTAPYHNYGYRKGQWYYAYNALSEIDQPGEWHLDRSGGVLYFWPPAPIESGEVVVSVLPAMVKIDGASHFALEGLVFEAARETALTMSGGTSNRIVGCTIRNVGGSAASVTGGSGHLVAGCDIYQCGSGGVSLSGGDRQSLAPAGHAADNNHIHHYGRWRPMYSAGISLSGVGNRATHNLIENAPHQAISFGGNDHLMEFNEIHSVCHESNDAGAIYSGRDWTMRGTVIRHNYLHDIEGFEGRGCVGVYLDDMYCGTDIIGNLFQRVRSAAFIGGGRDCRVENNVFVDCRPALHIDARAMGWAKYHADDWVKEGREKGTLSGIRYREAPYTRYPGLTNILEDDPWAPKANVVARNICVGGRWDNVESKARPMVRFENNLLDQDPKFVNAAAGNFQLQDDSPAWKLGFQRLPLERMGLYQDESRASWPVRHEVRPVLRSAVKTADQAAPGAPAVTGPR